MLQEYIFILPIIAALLAVVIIVALVLRRVVPTNEVHIIQTAKATHSYGKDTKKGNVYYEWPSWFPIIGLTKIVLPVSVFDIELESYEAYDLGRLPFEVDVVAFFRVIDSNLAAERVPSFEALREQLHFILRGAVRTILASHDIDQIMVDRSTFGEAFTKEVQSQLANWGVDTVKSIELMDIRDSQNNQVIHNIMQKKKSMIEKESRVEVAQNNRDAEISETNAKRDSDLQKTAAGELLGIRQAEQAQNIGIAKEKSNQSIQEQQKITREREMEVARVADVKRAEINRSVAVTKADEEKQATVLAAEARLTQQELEAKGIQAQGIAKAEAEKAINLAPVEAQIVLAKEIGENANYQKYLIDLRTVEASEKIGVEQAKALVEADVKIIANAGNPSDGVASVGKLFTSSGGMNVAGALAGLAATDEGKALLDKFTGGKK